MAYGDEVPPGVYSDAGGESERPKPRRPYDPRPAHPLTRAKRVVIATDAVKRAIAEGGGTTR